MTDLEIIEELLTRRKIEYTKSTDGDGDGDNDKVGKFKYHSEIVLESFAGDIVFMFNQKGDLLVVDCMETDNDPRP